MSSPVSPSGRPYDIQFALPFNVPTDSGGDPLDIASFSQKIDKVTFYSQNLPAPGDAMDINVFKNGVSILSAPPFHIADTTITTSEIEIPLNPLLTGLVPGDIVTVSRLNTVGVGMGPNYINVYKNDGSIQQQRFSPSGFNQRQIFQMAGTVNNAGVLEGVSPQSVLFTQFVKRADVIISAALAGGETITVNVLRNGVLLIPAFVITSAMAAKVNLSMPFVSPLVINRGDILDFTFTYSAGAGGLRTVQARVIGD